MSPLDRDDANVMAAALQGFATVARLLILDSLREGPLSALAVARRVGLARRTCAEELRVLCDLGLVVDVRSGRVTVYRLSDRHVADILSQALRHVRNRRDSVTNAPAPGVWMTT
jgi:ArsR family transcriptional regulator, nickel/cobalt-responsive transcriptional repressor